MSEKILVVDDEKNLRETLVEIFESENFAVASAEDGAEALLKIRAEDFACVFLDIKMPRMDGLQLLKKLGEENLLQTPIIVVSAFSDSEKTIEAMRLGAFDYLTKPLDIEEILDVLKRAVAQSKQNSQTEKRTEKPAENLTENISIIGSSRAMRDVFKQIGRVAATDATVLITGESGTGKELVARAIHEFSRRNNAPFIAVNCGAIPENLVESELFGYEKGAFTGAANQKKGKFEAAKNGTLLLDEIGEMPLSAQVKLLRALQERKFERVGSTNLIPFDARIIAATNRDLQTEIAAKNFREDLFYRFNVVSIHLPPLRERLADVPQLAEFFLERVVRKHKLPNKFLTDAAMNHLINQEFTGNVRELENIIERAAVTSGQSNAISAENLFEHQNPVKGSIKNFGELLDLPFKEAVGNLEKMLIEKALRESNGNRTEAAQKLGINRRLLYDKIKEHNISDD